MKKQSICLTVILSLIFQFQVSFGQTGLKVGGTTVETGLPTIVGNTGLTPKTNNAVLNILSQSATNTASMHIERQSFNVQSKISLTGSNGQNGLLFQMKHNSYPSYYTQPLKLLWTGQVVVGTNNYIAQYQTGQLYGDIKLFVKGGILAEEIKVATGWADYVFEDDYKLASLESVADFIDQNGHLPAIPSAAEIEEKGLAIGEMTVMQQEKIEELFLYMIDLKQEVQKLSEENKTLQETISQLQSR